MHPQQILNIRPGLRADLLEHRAFFANDDALMGIPLAIDGGVDFHKVIVFLFHGHHFHADAVGHFVPQISQGLFPDQLGANIPLGLIGEHIIGEIFGAHGQMRGQFCLEPIHAVAGAGADGHNTVIARILKRINDSQQRLGLHQINLIEHQQLIHLFLAHLGHNGSIMGADGSHIHQHQQRIDPLHGLLNGLHHEFAQLGAGMMDAGGIHKHDLAVIAAHHAHHPVAGGLRAIGHDGHLFANKCVQQGGFAHVGAAHNGGKPRMESVLFGHENLIPSLKIRGCRSWAQSHEPEFPAEWLPPADRRRKR